MAAAIPWRSGCCTGVHGQQTASCPPSLRPPRSWQAEVRRLRAQLQSVTNQRDILEKAVGIFAGPKRERFCLDRGPGRGLSRSAICARRFDVSRARLLRLASTRSERAGSCRRRLGRADRHPFCATADAPTAAPRLHRALRRAGHGLRAAPGSPDAGGAEASSGGVRGPTVRPGTTREQTIADPIAPNRLGQTGGTGGTARRRDGPPTSPTCRPMRAGSPWRACSTWAAVASWVGRWAISLETGLPHGTRCGWHCVNGSPPAGLLHHSDRGCQYASEAYREPFAAWKRNAEHEPPGATATTTRPWRASKSTLKEELVHRTHFENRAQAAGAIFDSIETFYNRERLHSVLGFMSPVEFEKQINLN